MNDNDKTKLGLQNLTIENREQQVRLKGLRSLRSLTQWLAYRKLYDLHIINMFMLLLPCEPKELVSLLISAVLRDL